MSGIEVMIKQFMVEKLQMTKCKTIWCKNEATEGLYCFRCDEHLLEAQNEVNAQRKLEKEELEYN
jgi:hypothetical protein